MAVLRVRLAGDPVLRQVATPVGRVTKRLVKLLRDMEETMYDADGVGLAAPQVGVSERVVVIDVGEGPLHLINPVIVREQGREIGQEGCLSYPGVFDYVERSASVVVDAMDGKGKLRRIEADGMLARALQHEIDHLDGVLFTDRIVHTTPEETGAGPVPAYRSADDGCEP